MSVISKLRHAVVVSRDMRWWPFYLQRKFMNPKVRSMVAGRMADRRKNSIQASGLDADALRRSVELNSMGLTHLGKVLNEEACTALVDYFLNCDVSDPHRPKSPKFKPLGQGRHLHAHIAHHDPCDIISAPGLLALANSPEVLTAVSAFLGCKPTLAYLAAWWSYSTPVGAQEAEFFHRDVDDWRFVKLFLYLTNVDEASGPHVYVTHSSASITLAQIRRFSDEEVYSAFPRQQILTMTGSAGDAFLEDTFGIHKGQSVQRGHRLIFQAVYSLHALPYGPTKPVAELHATQLANPGKLIDGWTNRYYLR